jgi:hypothetical protein
MLATASTRRQAEKIAASKVLNFIEKKHVK